MIIDLGKIGLTPKGEYNSSQTYEILDMVTSDGSSFVSKINGNNTPVSNMSTWQVVALKGDVGNNGISAYQIALNEGFVGTEQQWLDSLKGQDGIDGQDGKSAYEVALDNGFVGTEQQWLDSLQGVDGTNAQSFNYKGNVSNYSELPTTGNAQNDAYYNEDDQLWYIYNGISFPSDGEGVLITIPLAPQFDKTDSIRAQGGKQIYEWLYGDNANTELGSTTALTRADMNSAFSPNTTITYWMYNYIVPYSRAVLSEFQINIVNAGDVYIKRYKKSGVGTSATLTFQEQYIYTLIPGLNTINILTQPDKFGVVHDTWEWNSDDIIALYSSAGLKYTTVSSPYNGLWGHGSAPGNDTGNFTVSQLSNATGGLLLSLKFTEIITIPKAGQVVNVINESNANLIPNVQSIIDYVGNSVVKELPQIILVPSFGQSLAGGTDGGASTFSAPVDIAFTTGNVNSNVQDMNGGYVEMFKEMANQNNYKLPVDFKFMTSVAFLGGTCITDLSKGTATYNSLISQVQTAKNTANSLGKTFSVPAFTWTQGEEDYRAGGSNGINYNTGKYIPTQYATKLKQLVNDLNTDIKAITGQKEDVKCIMYQTASQNPYGRYPRIAIEQLKASIEDPRIILAKTMYDVEYNAADNVHAPNKTYRNMGNHYGISLYDAIVKKEHRLPIYPVKSTVVGTTIYIQFHVPVKPLVFDESWVSPLSDGNKGFNLYTVTDEYSTSATIVPSSVTITNVELVSADTIKLTLSGIPSSGTRLTYGVNGVGYNIINGNTSSGTRKSGRIEGARGNLRDSQTYFNPVVNYFNLYNWCPIFEIIL